MYRMRFNMAAIYGDVSVPDDTPAPSSFAHEFHKEKLAARDTRDQAAIDAGRGLSAIYLANTMYLHKPYPYSSGRSKGRKGYMLSLHSCPLGEEWDYISGVQGAQNTDGPKEYPIGVLRGVSGAQIQQVTLLLEDEETILPIPDVEHLRASNPHATLQQLHVIALSEYFGRNLLPKAMQWYPLRVVGESVDDNDVEGDENESLPRAA